MELSVIIVNYNVCRFLENALHSIKRAMAGIDGEIFVVDNASDDGSEEMVRSKFPDVHLIVNRINAGFARANNAALSHARGEFILLINPDTVVQEDTLQVMIRFFRDTPDAGLAGCKVLNPDGTFQLACRRSFPTPWVAFTKISGLAGLFPKSRLFGRYNMTYLSPDETYEVEAVSGSFMMTRRDVYKQIGGLDERFFMYGEDLDWCYRVVEAGWKVYYVPSTRIIHFKGESTRRSDIDEIRTFYHAMQLFVEKHFSRSVIGEFFLTLGILLRAAIAFVGRAGRTAAFAVVDFILVDLALMATELVYFGELLHFPDYAYPLVWTVPGLIVTGALYLGGCYTENRYSISRSALAVLSGYVIISAIVFFAKDFAFSRAVVIISGLLTMILIPGWRLLVSGLGAGSHGRARRSLFGRRTVIVGTGNSAQEVLRKLRARVDDGYDVLGFIDMNRRNIGEKIAGLEIIGSIDNVGKVIADRKVSEVIFSTDGIAYADILSVIGRSNSRNVNFRLVPNSLEAIIGKTRIDQLDDLPLIEIEYNIRKPVNRFAKRAFDITVSAILLVTVYPFVRIFRGGVLARGSVAQAVLLLPAVLSGRLSIVGRPAMERERRVDAEAGESYLGPCGLTGLVQINRREDVTDEETERYNLYYAKNQSLMLDLEILLKTLLLILRK